MGIVAFMNMKYSVENLLSNARQFKTIGEWRRADRNRYEQAVRRGIMSEIRKFLEPEPGGPGVAYTDEELAQDAHRFSTRAEWEAAGQVEMAEGKVSHYHCALGRGREFFSNNCMHMEQRHTWTDEELIESGRKYAHKGDWKRAPVRSDQIAYQLAIRRPAVFLTATAHMTPKASPYSHAYYIYACEFTDRHVYIGLSFRSTRKSEHAVRGPVRDHCAICPDYAFKVVQSEIATPSLAQLAEREWIKKYKADGWAMLNSADGGGLGTVQVVKWTKEAVFAQALLYKSKQAWIDGSQMSYRIAKREGWFEEASAHMPKRVLGVGAGVPKSAAAKEKMRQAKLGGTLSASHKSNIAASVHASWKARS